jgi:hypothetical protein
MRLVGHCLHCPGLSTCSLSRAAGCAYEQLVALLAAAAEAAALLHAIRWALRFSTALALPLSWQCGAASPMMRARIAWQDAHC